MTQSNVEHIQKRHLDKWEHKQNGTICLALYTMQTQMTLSSTDTCRPVGRGVQGSACAPPFRIEIYKQQYGKWWQSSIEFKVIGHPLACVHPPFNVSGYGPDLRDSHQLTLETLIILYIILAIAVLNLSLVVHTVLIIFNYTDICDTSSNNSFIFTTTTHQLVQICGIVAIQYTI